MENNRKFNEEEFECYKHDLAAYLLKIEFNASEMKATVESMLTMCPDCEELKTILHECEQIVPDELKANLAKIL